MRSLELIIVLLSVCLSIRPSGTLVYCNHTVKFRVNFSLWLDSPMFCAPWHQIMYT